MKSGADTFGPAGKNESLEGLRAVAIGLVLLYHAGAPGAASGWLGVDLFFVLSGFLITTLLLREHGRTGRIALGDFWYRRCLRLLPAYCGYALVLTFLILGADPQDIRFVAGYTPVDLVVAIWTFTINYVSGEDVWQREYLVRHLWSLALEWQFYLLFPLVLVVVLRWRWWAVPILLPLLVLILDAVFEFPGPQRWTITGRGIALMLGSAAAFYLHHFRDALLPWFTRMHWPAILVIAAAYAFLEISARGEVAGSMLVMAAFWAAASVIVANFWYAPDIFGRRLLSLSPLVFIGKISYGMYLWHMLSWEFVWEGIPPEIFADLGRSMAYGIKLGIYAGLTVVMAILSFHGIERPFLSMNRKFRSQAEARLASGVGR